MMRIVILVIVMHDMPGVPVMRMRCSMPVMHMSRGLMDAGVAGLFGNSGERGAPESAAGNSNRGQQGENFPNPPTHDPSC